MKPGIPYSAIESNVTGMTTIPDILNRIFSFLPEKQILIQRRLNKRCRAIIDANLINNPLTQETIQKIITDENDRKALFAAQEREIACLKQNKRAIFSLPKVDSNIVQTNEELIIAFQALENAPHDISFLSLYRRHKILEQINLDIIFDKCNQDILYNMIVAEKVIDFSGMYLTRLPRAIFQMYIDRKFYALPRLLNLENNCLTSLPTCLEFLTNLKVLNVANNQLTCLPQTLKKLIALETILLANNNLENIAVLGSLQNLNHVDVRRNNLTTIPESLKLRLIKPLTILSTGVQLRSIAFMHLTSQDKILATQKEVPEYLRKSFQSLRLGERKS